MTQPSTTTDAFTQTSSCVVNANNHQLKCKGLEFSLCNAVARDNSTIQREFVVPGDGVNYDAYYFNIPLCGAKSSGQSAILQHTDMFQTSPYGSYDIGLYDSSTWKRGVHSSSGREAYAVSYTGGTYCNNENPYGRSAVVILVCDEDYGADSPYAETVIEEPKCRCKS